MQGHDTRMHRFAMRSGWLIRAGWGEARRMDPALDLRLDRIDEGMATLALALRIVNGTQRIHGERLDKIIELLTPEKDGDGPNVVDVLSQILERLDALTRHTRTMTETLTEMARNLPLETVRAFDDNYGGLPGKP